MPDPFTTEVETRLKRTRRRQNAAEKVKPFQESVAESIAELQANAAAASKPASTRGGGGGNAPISLDQISEFGGDFARNALERGSQALEFGGDLARSSTDRGREIINFFSGNEQAPAVTPAVNTTSPVVPTTPVKPPVKPPIVPTTPGNTQGGGLFERLQTTSDGRQIPSFSDINDQGQRVQLGPNVGLTQFKGAGRQQTLADGSLSSPLAFADTDINDPARQARFRSFNLRNGPTTIDNALGRAALTLGISDRELEGDRFARARAGKLASQLLGREESAQNARTLQEQQDFAEGERTALAVDASNRKARDAAALARGKSISEQFTVAGQTKQLGKDTPLEIRQLAAADAQLKATGQVSQNFQRQIVRSSIGKLSKLLTDAANPGVAAGIAGLFPGTDTGKMAETIKSFSESQAPLQALKKLLNVQRDPKFGNFTIGGGGVTQDLVPLDPSTVEDPEIRELLQLVVRI